MGTCLRALVILAQISAAPPLLPRGAVCQLGSDNYRGKSDGGLVFLPDSKTFVTNGGFCDAATGTWTKRFPTSHNSFKQIRLAPNRECLATLRSEFDRDAASYKYWIDTWNLEGALISSLLLEGHKDRIERFALTPDCEHIVTAGGSWVQIRDRQSGEIKKALQFEKSELVSIEVSPIEDVIACGARSAMWFWDWRMEGPPDAVPGIKRGPVGGAFSPDGKLFAAEHGFAFGVSLISTQSREIVRSLLPDKARADSMNLTFSSDGQHLFAPQLDAGVAVWNVATGQHERTLPSDGVMVKSVAVSPDGRWLAAGGNMNSAVAVWDAVAWKSQNHSEGHRNDITTIAFSKDGSRLATGSVDQTVRVWDSASGREVAVMSGHTGFITKVGFSPDGTKLASVALDDSVRLWNPRTGELIKSLSGHGRFGGLGAILEFSDDGVLLTSGGADLTLRRRNLQTLESVSEMRFSPAPEGAAIEPWQLLQIDQPVVSVAVSNFERCLIFDGRTGEQTRSFNWPGAALRFASAGDSKSVAAIIAGPSKTVPLANGGQRHEAPEKYTLAVFNVASGRQRLKVDIPGGFHPDCKFSPDAKLIAVAMPGPSGPLIIFDAVTGAERYRIDDQCVDGFAMCFSPDTSHLVSCTRLGRLTLWDLSQFEVK